MENIISELSKFSNEILDLGVSIKDLRVEEFENSYSINLPNDFKKFMKKINGFNLMGSEVYSFDKSKSESIENVYYYEHFDVHHPQYSHLVPFCNDGRGNFYCLDTLNTIKNGDSPIVFWVSNYEYTLNDIPEIVNNNFLEWIQEVIIDWTLEDYNYDGTEK